MIHALTCNNYINIASYRIYKGFSIYPLFKILIPYFLLKEKAI